MFRWPDQQQQAAEVVAAQTTLLLNDRRGHDQRDLLTFYFCGPLYTFILVHLLSLALLLFRVLHSMRRRRSMSRHNVLVNEMTKTGDIKDLSKEIWEKGQLRAQPAGK